jgi:GDPmannose 4,6-dehydratase
LETTIELGNLDSRRDWGYAPEYVKAMWLILQHDQPDDFVVATNKTHSIREFLEVAFKRAGLDWENHVIVEEKYKRPLDVFFLKGDYSKSKRILKWEPETDFETLVNLMVDKDLERWSNWVGGKHFPWDAWNYPNEKKILSRKFKYD